MPEPEVYAERLEVLGAEGEHVRWVDEEQARDLVKRGVAAVRRTKRRIRALQLVPAAARIDEAGGRRDLKNRGLQAGAAHACETQKNPRGVWTIEKLPASTRDIFLAVVEDCRAA